MIKNYLFGLIFVFIIRTCSFFNLFGPPFAITTKLHDASMFNFDESNFIHKIISSVDCRRFAKAVADSRTNPFSLDCNK